MHGIQKISFFYVKWLNNKYFIFLSKFYYKYGPTRINCFKPVKVIIMKTTAALISFAAILAITNANPVPRVVGGTDAKLNEFPYQISIQYEGRHHCGGSILNEYYILTAAHCATAVSDTIIIAGAHNLHQFSGHEQIRHVEEFINHENSTSEVGPYDIALIKLTEPLILNEFVQPISLPKANKYPEGNATISGWGSTSRELDPIFPDVLQVKIKLLVCKELFKFSFKRRKQLCQFMTKICALDVGH